MTADNASNNLTMARELEDQIATFKEAHHMLGCTGHVFNFAAHCKIVIVKSIHGSPLKRLWFENMIKVA